MKTSSSATALLSAIFWATHVRAQAGDPVGDVKAKSTAIPGDGIPTLNTLNGGGLVTLSDHAPVKKRWSNTAVVPEGCAYWARHQDNLCDADNLEVYDVLYSDCPAPVVVCRCPGTTSIDSLAREIGKVPPGARYAVRNWISVFNRTDVNGCGVPASAGGVDILLKGNACLENVVSAYIHEAAHVLDFIHRDKTTGEPWSNSNVHRQAIDKDTCVADWYARDSRQEALAQTAVLVAYDANIAKYTTINTNLGDLCMANQFTAADALLREYMANGEGATCTVSWLRQKNVCISEAAKAAGRCDGIDTNNPEQETYAGVTLMDPEPIIQAMEAFYGGKGGEVF